MARRLNSNEGPQFVEEHFVAAAIAVPVLDSEAPPRPLPTPPTEIGDSDNQVGNGGKADVPGQTASGAAILGALIVILS